MAEYLASIYGTEKDNVNCSFFLKMGACRHGERCSRLHLKPTYSPTVLLKGFYDNPIANASVEKKLTAQQDFDDLFEEIFTELNSRYGPIEEMNVCDNLGDHLIGNVYVMFKNEEIAEQAVEHLNTRWFNMRPIHAELSPVTDFRGACCRQYEVGECKREGFCNFLHLKPISRALRRSLYDKKRDRSPSKKRRRSRDRSRDRRSGEKRR